MKNKLVTAAIAPFATLFLSSVQTLATEQNETITMKVPQEVSVVCDTFIKGEDAPPGNKLTLSMTGSLGTRQNPDNKAWELVINLRGKMVAGVLQGAFKGEEVVVIKTFPLDVKQVALQDGYPTTQKFSWTEDYSDKPKQFGWSHQGFDRRDPNDKHKLIGHIFYDGPTTKKLRILLNTELPPLNVKLTQ